MCAAPQYSCACIRECRGEHFSREDDDLNKNGVNKDQVLACVYTHELVLTCTPNGSRILSSHNIGTNNPQNAKRHSHSQQFE